MKKSCIMASVVLLILPLVSGPASAWDRHPWGGHHQDHLGFGFFIGPPAVYYAPRAVYRVWVPGYWDWRWSGHAWERMWIPGYWQWR